MLPKDLLLVSYSGGSVKPRYLNITDQADQVISIFKTCINKKYKVLKKRLSELESGRTDYKVLRGLAQLIQRRCTFTSSTELDTLEIRRALFQSGFVKDEIEREKVVSRIADEFGVTKDEIKNAMFADLPKEQVLKQLTLPAPKELIQSYNLSLIQTLLFNATVMTFTVGTKFQQIFRTINFLGLMYETDGKEITISGPISLLKHTKKYGTSFAKLLPYILQSDNWSFEAKVQMQRGKQSRIYEFGLDSKDPVLLPIYEQVEEGFDSEVEEQLYKDLTLYAPDWEIKREPTFIKAGKYVIIPDFGFYKRGIKIYLEVVGFWTPEYIEKKIKKFNQTDTKIIAAVNQNLKCTRRDFPGEVIFYKKHIPIKPILEILKREEEKMIEAELKNFETIEFDEEIVDKEKKAKELDLSPKTLEQIEIPGYHFIGQKIVSNIFLEKLNKEIGEKRKFSEVKKILDKYNLTDKALELIGYQVIWKGLSPIKIVKIK
ncbi:MAG: DUF790 family protein [Promethearchaeota archaeon]